MGDPKKQRKKYKTPKFPWQSEVLKKELELIGKYGLRNKRELWRHNTMLSRIRRNARSLLGKSSGERDLPEKQLINRLIRLGLLSEGSALDDVLDLSVEEILERRLQTIVFRNGLAKTPYQARQLITHGHIAIGDRRILSPGYIVKREDEPEVGYHPKSPLAATSHPIRVSLDQIRRVEATPKGA